MLLFVPCTVAYGDNPHARGAKITCGRCGAEARKHFNTLTYTNGDDGQLDKLMTRKFEQEGWKIGKTAGQHRCPTCKREARAAQMRYVHATGANKKMATNGATETMSTITMSKDPPTMQRSDRRVIFTKLEECYGSDEKTGYQNDWTDNKVAMDLGVPVAWVSQVREENFGPASNPTTDALLSEAREWRDEVAKLQAQLTTVTAQNTTLIGLASKLLTRGEMLERKLFGVEKQLGPRK